MKYLIGIGNYSMGDDGVGLKIVEYIEENISERDFDIIDMSDNGLNIVAYLNEDTEKILFVDCVMMGKSPGETAFFTPDQVKTDKELANISTHEGDMIKILDMVKGLDYHIPPIKFLGIEPKTMEGGEMELSDLISKNLPSYVEMAIKEINKDWNL
jgi:hydrogenase maturation protease